MRRFFRAFIAACVAAEMRGDQSRQPPFAPPARNVAKLHVLAIVLKKNFLSFSENQH
jgi:hypothetical protein